MGSTERVTEIISFLASDKKSHSLSEIPNQLGISKTTAHRIVTSLEKLRWLERDSVTKKYRLGPALLQIGLSALSQLDISSISLRYLEKLHGETNESTMLTLRLGLERVFIEQIVSDAELRMVAELGKRYPLWCGAQGKVILAYLKEEEQNSVINKMIQSGYKKTASGEPVNIDNLRKQLEEIRVQGFATSFGERVPGSTAVASAIFGHTGRVLGAISIAGAMQRFSVDIIKHYGDLVRKAAAAISEELGAPRK